MFKIIQKSKMQEFMDGAFMTYYIIIIDLGRKCRENEMVMIHKIVTAFLSILGIW